MCPILPRPPRSRCSDEFSSGFTAVKTHVFLSVEREFKVVHPVLVLSALDWLGYVAPTYFCSITSK
jgi:hypothetical protein